MADTPKTPDDATGAPKPASKRRRAPRASTTPAASPPRKRTPKPAPAIESAPAPAKRAAPPKSRSTKRATPAPKPRVAAAGPERSTLALVAEKLSGRWATAALAAASGAAVAALFTLRGSTPKPTAAPPATVPTGASAGGAHQADGSDSAASFQAGIADEGTIPD